MKRENCAVMSLSNPDSKSYVKYIRDPDGFYYIMFYELPEIGSIDVVHYFANHYLEDFDNGEIIAFKYYEKGEFTLDVRYNISQGKVGATYGDRTLITLEQKQFILKKLEEAYRYASSITLDNLKNKRNTKKLVDGDNK